MSPLTSKYSYVSSPEGCVAQGVTKRIDCRIDVAEAVCDIPQHIWDYLSTLVRAQNTFHHSKHVVRSPSKKKHKQDG